jgi:fatty-acyl-CoA synthase
MAAVLAANGIVHLLVDDLSRDRGDSGFTPVDAPEDSPALLQLTSGSTAEPKGVRITHRNLFANLNDSATHLGCAETGTMVSWLPMFHDMGMVGFYTTPMAFGIELVKVTPVEFLTAPLLWAKLISDYRGTITAAPNFAYALLGRRLSGVDNDDEYDLSTLRIALNGAEPIDEKAVAAFVAAGARFHMPAECVFPAYGMAEGTLAISFASPMIGLRLDHVNAVALEEENKAVPVPEDTPEADRRTFAILGPPLDGFEARIVSTSTGEVRGPREVGEIQVKGASVTPGYLTVDGPLATQDEEGWLSTGDLGYLVEGEIVICGRAKDVIILAGRNIYPTDIERAATSVDGVRAGNAVAVRLDAGTRRERFAVVVESRFANDAEKVKTLRKEIGARVFEAVNARPSSVLVLPAGTLPKTPSGKLRRAAAGEQLAESIRDAAS